MTINDENVQDIETFMRGELLDLLQGKCRKMKVEFNEEDMAHFYGLYESNPNNFKLLSGEKKLIKVLAKHLNDIHEADKDMVSFQMAKCYKISRKDTYLFPFGLYFGGSNTRVRPITAAAHSVETELVEPSKPENMKDYVRNKVNKMLESLGIVESKVFHESSIKIVNSGNDILANVTCAFCKLENKMKSIVVQAETRNDSTSLYWNIGNLKKHVVKMHISRINSA